MIHIHFPCVCYVGGKWFGPHLLVVKVCSWLYTQESLLEVLKWPDGVPGYELGSTVCKASVLPIVLFLQLTFFLSFLKKYAYYPYNFASAWTLWNEDCTFAKCCKVCLPNLSFKFMFKTICSYINLVHLEIGAIL